jgi:RHS repeat-associated protein
MSILAKFGAAAVRCLRWMAGALLLVIASPALAGVTVSMFFPSEGEVFNPPTGPILLGVVVSASDGYSVSKVEYFDGTTLIASSTGPGWAKFWTTGASAGIHSLTAKATAVKAGSPDITATSAPRTITVNAVGISLFVGSVQYTPGSISLNPTVGAIDGYTVSKVEFFDGATLIGMKTGAPWILDWTNPTIGSHAITARATGVKAGHPDVITTTPVRNVTVYYAPSISFTSPANNAQYTVGQTIALNVVASPGPGGAPLQSVEIFTPIEFCGDGPCSVVLGTFTAPPYSVEVVLPEYPGTHTYGATAVDSTGAPRTAYVNLIVAPSLSLTSPAPGATYTAPATIPLSLGIDPSVYYYWVEYYAGSTLIGQGYFGLANTVWNNVPAGTYSISAKVHSADMYGTVFTTPSVNVTVAATAQAKTLHFVHVDHLNTPREIYDASAQLRWKWDQQEPFGVNVPDENPSSLGAFEFAMRFPGQYFDKETNLSYNYFRNFDPILGRYVESDPIGLAGGINTYSYAYENPLSWSDPLGLAPSAKNKQKCESLARTINNTKKDIEKRIGDISTNPQSLPLLPPYPGAANRASVSGHQKIIDEMRGNLNRRIKEYKDKCCDDCDDNGGGGGTGSSGTATTAIAAGTVAVACVIGCILLPEICIPALVIGGGTVGAAAK